MKSFPKYIALCGWPKSGKDEVAKTFERLLNARVIDDGVPLRRAAPHLFNYDHTYPYSQEGKSKMVEVPNGEVDVRYTLGELGKYLEAHYGPQFMAWRAIKESERYEYDHFIFPSCRRTNGMTYQEAGGVVIEVCRPGYDSSPYDFDWYDPAFVDYQIHNTGTLFDLSKQVANLIVKLTQ